MLARPITLRSRGSNPAPATLMKMTKRVFLVHGWGGSPEANWFPWLKKELESKGFEVRSLKMPNTDNPTIPEWVSFLKKEAGKPNKDTFFVGCSIGCQTIMRYLQDISGEVGGVLFVAGWFTLKGLETEEEKQIAKPWFASPINLAAVKKVAPKITAIFSTDDPFVPLSDTKKFERELNAKIIIEKDKGHFDEERYDIILKEFLNLTK